MGFFRLVFLPFAAAIAFYFYRFFRRAFRTFSIDTDSLRSRIILWVLAGCVGAAFMAMPDLPGIVVLHLLAIAAVLQLINFITRKAAGAKYEDGLRLWKKLYGCGILPILLTAAVILYGFYNMNHVVQTSYTIRTEKAIRPEGYRIAMIADVHYGISVGYDELMNICEAVSSQDPDLVILCGDIVDNNTTCNEMKQVFQALGTIDSQYGTFYVFGNHDRPMSIVESAYTEAELISTIESNNITILKDETYTIHDDFILAGRDDRGYSRGSTRMEISTLLQDVNRESFILTLDHQPNQYAQNAEAGTDLLLSGHTHGGQIWPINVLDNIFKFNEANYGHIRIDEDTQAIVTSGLAGWGWPIKTAAPAEYVIIDIQNG